MNSSTTVIIEFTIQTGRNEEHAKRSQDNIGVGMYNEKGFKGERSSLLLFRDGQASPEILTTTKCDGEQLKPILLRGTKIRPNFLIGGIFGFLWEPLVRVPSFDFSFCGGRRLTI